MDSSCVMEPSPSAASDDFRSEFHLATGHTPGPYQEHHAHYATGMGRSPGPEAEARLTTVGEPLRASHSPLGRGICVWRAVLDPKKISLVLKVSWQDPEPSETRTHDILTSFLRNAGVEEPRGLVLATPAGGDIYDDSRKGMPVSNRRGLPDEYEPVVDRVLRRICMTRFGKPIWEYSSLQEFARAMRDAVQAHDVLSSHGILHRNINAGNILIDVDASYKAATTTEPEGIVLKDRDPQNASGFLSGWKSAWFPQDVLDIAAGHAQDLDSADPDLPAKFAPPSETITDNFIFLATEVLFGLSAKAPVVPSRVHDLESFEWVILYSIYAQSIKIAFDDPKVLKFKATKFREEFQNIFRAVDPSSLADKRVILFLPGTFGSIGQLLWFLEAHVVGSTELLNVLMDIWEDLMYRYRAVSSHTPPSRPGSFFQNKKPKDDSVECMEHKDLINCLETLIPRT